MALLILLLFLLSSTFIFLITGWVLRLHYPQFSRGLYLFSGVIGLVVFFLWLAEVAGWQRKAHYEQVVYSLQDESYWNHLEETEQIEETLLMMSMASQGLYQRVQEDADLRTEVVPLLGRMVRWVADEHRFPQWNRRGDWERHAFFLAHAGIIIGHYQLLTLDETYNTRWRRIGTYLGEGITRSSYKHLASRPRDEALRPYDNAAVLYALSLFDRYYGEELLPAASRDWQRYVDLELQHNDTALPCAGFTPTNRCRLYPVASSLALLTGYSAAAGAPLARDFWREYKHYYKKLPYPWLWASFRITPAGVDRPQFCDMSIKPLGCGNYQNALSQWAAACRGDRLTYFHLHNTLYLRDILGKGVVSWRVPVRQRTGPLLETAIRLAGETI